MNFMEAVKAMKEGKKVKRRGLYPVYLNNNNFVFHNEDEERDYTIDIGVIEATDWEIVEDKKTLSDKIISADGLHHEVKVCIAQDVKEAIKEFIEWMNIHRLGINPDKYLPKAKEIFGERLL